MPLYLLTPLMQYLPAIAASEQRQAITASAAPHTKRSDYQSLMRSLGRTASALDPPPPPEPPREHVEIDREKARAWFEAQGVRVVEREKVDTA
jgi:hypothetical protein